MESTLDFLPWVQIVIVVLLIGIIYILLVKIPFPYEQQEEGERIMMKRAIQDYIKTKKEFKEYFRKIFRLLIAVSLVFFIVNILLAWAINIFVASQGIEFIFSRDLPVFYISRGVFSLVLSFMMCGAGWLTIIFLNSD